MIQNYKIFENMAKARKILADLRLPEDNPKFIELKELLKKHPGYLGTFTKWYLQDHEDLNQIEEVYKLAVSTGIDKPIESFEKLEDLYDYMTKFEINRKVKQVIKSLPSRTRELVTDELRNIISLNPEYAKNIKDLYSKKGGRYKEIGPLLQDTKDYIKNLKGGFNLDVIKGKMEGLNVDTIIETPELLMIRVNNFHASKNIGSKHWCIVTSESYWNSYVNEFTTQYFIFDFTKDVSDKKYMIGATISPSGKITYAHWADDSPVRDMTYFDSL